MSTETHTGRADALPGAYRVMSPRKPVGSRRDRQLHELQTRVKELEDFVDTMGAALTELRRHAQFHGAGAPDDTFTYGVCGICHPTQAETDAGSFA